MFWVVGCCLFLRNLAISVSSFIFLVSFLTSIGNSSYYIGDFGGHRISGQRGAASWLSHAGVHQKLFPTSTSSLFLGAFAPDSYR
ncbi:hypothetical protein F5X68DRAFT_196632 [Plectosphaerella plurivora]|uniref:Uncharacterized protein n=1 Tax=Plectosphaerella plurivora TaxID=936078 RepID=A0A9P8VNY9_9PEZI|nr:hypothetical protein F5X68DRAFT_196632 [Plectosphaerella plurivora]